MKGILMLTMAMFMLSCNNKNEDLLLTPEKFNMNKVRAEVISCERIHDSVLDDINPRYRIVTSDSMIIKSYYAVNPGDTIMVKVYKRK